MIVDVARNATVWCSILGILGNKWCAPKGFSGARRRKHGRSKSGLELGRKTCFTCLLLERLLVCSVLDFIGEETVTNELDVFLATCLETHLASEQALPNMFVLLWKRPPGPCEHVAKTT